MKHNNTYNANISFELFPPNTNQGLRQIYEAVYQLARLNPDFFSVTYGAGGSTAKHSIEIASAILHLTKNICIPHFTCMGNTKELVSSMLAIFEEQKITSVMALRGDKVPDQAQNQATDFKYAVDLVRFIRETTELNILVAGYPEGHIEAKDKKEDWQHTKEKIAAGANGVVTQLTFDNQYIYDFCEYLETESSKVPVLVGIFPLSNVKQLERITKLTKVKIPQDLKQGIEKYGDNTADFYAFATDYAIKQIEDLLHNHFTHFHFYTMNRSKQTIEILSALRHYFPITSLL